MMADGLLKWILALPLLATLGSASSQTEPPAVQIEQGVLTGKYLKSEVLNRDIASFLGIPYSSQPIRFKAAEPPGPWPGVLRATSHGPECLQYSPDGIKGSEDCLFLNVYTPKLPKENSTNELMEVLFYIHGGAFMVFSGNPFGPEYLLDNDIVLVTHNYRLGALGFLSTDDDVVPGNNGLKDQLLALKWVRKNIAKFGGDPDKITLSGMSAGSASVHYHVISPQSKGLFRNAIMTSGSALNPWPQTENSLEKAKLIGLQLGCPVENNVEMIDCLRTRSAHQIVANSKLAQVWISSPFTTFGPVVEPEHSNAFIDHQPRDLIVNKKANDVPLLFSFTADEGLFPGAFVMSSSETIEYLKGNLDRLLPHLLDYNFTVPDGHYTEVGNKVKAFYLDKHDFATGIIHMFGDRHFKVGIREAAKLHAEFYNSPTYAYIFCYKGAVRGFTTKVYDGVGHGDDDGYVFKSMRLWGPPKTEKRSPQMIKYMVDLWVNFIKGTIKSGEWPDVKQNLPAYGYLNISSVEPQENKFSIDNNTLVDEFWKSLNLKENA